MQLVPEVRSVTLKANEKGITISVEGVVPTSGWANAELGAWFYVTVPEDGIQDVDLMAEPPKPGQIVLQVVTTLSAEVVIPRTAQDYWGPGKPLQGVRVHARKGSVVEMLDAGGAAAFRDENTLSGGATLSGSLRLSDGDLVPWPWLARFETTSPS